VEVYYQPVSRYPLNSCVMRNEAQAMEDDVITCDGKEIPHALGRRALDRTNGPKILQEMKQSILRTSILLPEALTLNIAFAS
jgi:hypothetical protein